MNHVRGALCALAFCLPVFALPSSALAGPFTDVPVPSAVPSFWADSFSNLVRGPQDSSDPNSPLASVGSGSLALGPSAPGNPADVVSLGNGGSITLGFNGVISDGVGADFAVFENGFEFGGDSFGELAFVEVSSNGIDFALFESTSFTPSALGDFDPIDVTDVHNLAGQFVQGLGTPFDLADLVADPLVGGGLLDLSNIAFVRLTDVVGDGSTLDGQGNPIFDPFPTAFGSSGFDLEAVGVLNGVNLPEPSMLLLSGLATGLLLLRRR